MQTYDTLVDATSGPGLAPPAYPDTAEAVGRMLAGGSRVHPHHESAALTSALDDGLMPDEVERILAGRRVDEAFPVRWGESPRAYASRAVSEMFVAYLR